MKTKLIISSLGLGTLFLIAVMMGGCGETVYESSTYYYPNWMPDGRVICYKVTSKWSTAIWGRKELGDTNYIAAMDADGNNEVNLFEVSGGADEITCSPTGELIAYIGTPYRKIIITNYTGSSTTVLPGITDVNYLDWSPDASKIVYSDKFTRTLYVVNIDGSNKTQIATSAEVVAWRAGEKIVYEYVVGSNPIKISTVTSDGSTINQLKTGIMPQMTNLQIIIFRSGGILKSMSITGTNETTLAESYDRASLKLSFDNAKIVGGDLDQSWIKGIWVTNLTGEAVGTAKRIR